MRKKEKPKTYEKLKLKKEDFENGTEEHNAAKILSDYFIEHTGIIVSYKTHAIVNALNKIIQKYSFKCISNSFYDMSYMIKVCNEDSIQIRRVRCLLYYSNSGKKECIGKIWISPLIGYETCYFCMNVDIPLTKDEWHKLTFRIKRGKNYKVRLLVSIIQQTPRY